MSAVMSIGKAMSLNAPKPLTQTFDQWLESLDLGPLTHRERHLMSMAWVAALLRANHQQLARIDSLLDKVKQ